MAREALLWSGKHHCRRCGKCFCTACSTAQIPLPMLGFVTPVRVCDDCFDLEMAEAGERERKLRKELLASTAAMSAEERLATASQLETRVWPLSYIRAVLPRRYLHRETGVELFYRQNSASSQQSAVLLR